MQSSNKIEKKDKQEIKTTAEDQKRSKIAKIAIESDVGSRQICQVKIPTVGTISSSDKACETQALTKAVVSSHARASACSQILTSHVDYMRRESSAVVFTAIQSDPSMDLFEHTSNRVRSFNRDSPIGPHNAHKSASSWYSESRFLERSRWQTELLLWRLTDIEI